jgi:hypothetical protein
LRLRQLGLAVGPLAISLLQLLVDRPLDLGRVDALLDVGLHEEHAAELGVPRRGDTLSASLSWWTSRRSSRDERAPPRTCASRLQPIGVGGAGLPGTFHTRYSRVCGTWSVMVARVEVVRARSAASSCGTFAVGAMSPK